MNDRAIPWPIAIIVALVLLGGLYYLAREGSPSAASIKVLAPAGGEQWENGSEHLISWARTGIPANYKISVTIRRIPPPPLQEEGQEFDPIVFTNLPNTGSTTWLIADMYPPGTYELGLTAYESLPITNPIMATSSTFEIAPHPLDAALEPLYTGATWGAPRARAQEMGTSTISGTAVESTPVLNTMNPGKVFGPYLTYYDQKLKALGWKEDNSLAANGPASGQVVYRKGSSIIFVLFSTLFHTVTNTAPSQCPCDVSLTLFSASQ